MIDCHGVQPMWQAGTRKRAGGTLADHGTAPQHFKSKLSEEEPGHAAGSRLSIQNLYTHSQLGGYGKQGHLVEGHLVEGQMHVCFPSIYVMRLASNTCVCDRAHLRQVFQRS